jgi:glutaredoxin
VHIETDEYGILVHDRFPWLRLYVVIDLGLQHIKVQRGDSMIELYMREGCPFCQKILAAVEQLGMEEGKDFTVIDAAPETPGREVVLRVGGKAMVPFMVDKEISMYESDDIIAYLERKFGGSRS